MSTTHSSSSKQDESKIEKESKIGTKDKQKEETQQQQHKKQVEEICENGSFCIQIDLKSQLDASRLKTQLIPVISTAPASENFWEAKKYFSRSMSQRYKAVMDAEASKFLKTLFDQLCSSYYGPLSDLHTRRIVVHRFSSILDFSSLLEKVKKQLHKNDRLCLCVTEQDLDALYGISTLKNNVDEPLKIITKEKFKQYCVIAPDVMMVRDANGDILAKPYFVDILLFSCEHLDDIVFGVLHYLRETENGSCVFSDSCFQSITKEEDREKTFVNIVNDSMLFHEDRHSIFYVDKATTAVDFTTLVHTTENKVFTASVKTQCQRIQTFLSSSTSSSSTSSSSSSSSASVPSSSPSLAPMTTTSSSSSSYSAKRENAWFGYFVMRSRSNNEMTNASSSSSSSSAATSTYEGFKFWFSFDKKTERCDPNRSSYTKDSILYLPTCFPLRIHVEEFKTQHKSCPQAIESLTELLKEKEKEKEKELMWTEWLHLDYKNPNDPIACYPFWIHEASDFDILKKESGLSYEDTEDGVEVEEPCHVSKLFTFDSLHKNGKLLFYQKYDSNNFPTFRCVPWPFVQLLGFTVRN